MDRKVTDCGCCLLFIAVILTMFYMAALGLRKGDVDALIGGIDGFNRICGTGELKDYKHLYISRLNSNNLG